MCKFGLLALSAGFAYICAYTDLSHVADAVLGAFIAFRFFRDVLSVHLTYRYGPILVSRRRYILTLRYPTPKTRDVKSENSYPWSVLAFGWSRYIVFEVGEAIERCLRIQSLEVAGTI